MLGNKTLLKRKNPVTNGADLTIGEIVAITPPALARDAIEVSRLNSDHKEYEGGMKDGGELTLEVNFFNPSFVEPTEDAKKTYHGLVFGDYESGDVVEYKLFFPDDSVWTLPCIVTAYTVTTPINDRIKAAITLKVAGKPTFPAI